MEMKRCSACGAVKAIGEFPWRSGSERRHGQCAPCYRESRRRTGKAYRERNPNAKKNWDAANPTAYVDWVARNRDRRRQLDRAHYARNRGARIANVRRRRAALRNVPTQLIAHARKGAEVDGACYWCGGETEDPHKDHILPLTRGGPHCDENVVTTCAQCNLTKGAKSPWAWVAELVS